MLSVEMQKCTGCTMCAQICPTKAITFKIDEGFRYPLVDETKCINCDLCNQRCPVNKKFPLNDSPQVYAVWIKNDDQRMKCTSGGVLYELSRYILEQGGYVAGVAWAESFRTAKYELIHSVQELPRITQTKYFQPEMGEIYKDVKNALKTGAPVLFIGTSCSNAGLRSYLNKDYENLYLCDFICRGYTSQLYHQKRVEALEKSHHSRLTGVYYKDKSIGWDMFGTKFDFEDGTSYYVNRFDDPYEYMLHTNDFVTRTSCFDCKYRKTKRMTDITVGDFWGIHAVPEEAHLKGVSAVLLNSEKGRDLFLKIDEVIYKEKRSMSELSNGNLCLQNQLSQKSGRKAFYEDLDRMPIEKIHAKYGNIRKEKMLYKVHSILRKLRTLSEVNPVAFIHYNFCCKSVQRDRRCFIVPKRGTRLQIEKNSEIVLHDHLFLNTLKHKHSREETFLHTFPGSKLIVAGNVQFAATSSIDVLPGAVLELGQLNSNYGTVIVCSNRITIGDGAEFGRNVLIYDSNYHPTKLNSNVKGRPLVIGNHVWLCTGVSIAQGITIGDGAICGLNSTVSRNVKPRTMMMGNPAKCVMEDVEW